MEERFKLFGKHCIKDNSPDARPQLFDIYAACVILNEQDQYIKKLEQENLSLQEQSIRDNQNWIEETTKLKQQLHDLPKKIVEDITNELSNNTSLYFEMRESTSAHCPNKEYEWFNYVRFRNYINAILEKFGGEDE